MSAPAAAPTDPFALRGQTLAGRFLIERPVAEGGFGVVYRARQLALERPVAIKVLKVTVEQEAALGRTFQAEAQTVARLRHPNIVEVYDFGVSAAPSGGGLCWMALEWLEGQTLDSLLAERRAKALAPLSRTEVIELLRPVFAAMAYAHREGVIHRDLKPSNIFLADVGGQVIPKVLDFGIAQMVEGPSSATSDRDKPDATRQFPGFSPAYAAPEQVSYGKTGPWTDVHALGLITTEILTQQPPYPTDDQETCFEAIIDERRPTPASKRVDVAGWEPVLQRALARRPVDRYPDVAALLAELERATEDAPAGRPGGWRRWTTATIVALMLALTGGLATWRLTGDTSKGGRVMLAVLPFENLTGDPQQDYFSDGLTEEIIGELGRLSPERLGVVGRTSVMQYKGTRKSARDIGRELGVGYLLESSVKREGRRVRVNARLVQVSDQTEIWADRYDRDLEHILSLESEIARAIASSVRLTVVQNSSAMAGRVRTVNPSAFDAYLKGQYFAGKPGREARERRIAYLEEASQLDPGYAQAYAALAWARYFDPFESRPHDTAPRAKADALRALALDERLADAHVALGMILLSYDWNWRQAEQHLVRALELEPNHQIARRYYGGSFLQSAGRFAEGITQLKQAKDIDPQHGPIYHLIGRSYYFARQFDHAVDELGRAVAVSVAGRPGAGWLAWAHAVTGEYQKGLAVLDAVSDPNAEHQSARGYLEARSGRTSVALANLERMKLLGKTTYVDSQWLARVYVGLGRKDEAFAALEEAFKERSRLLCFLKVDPIWDAIRPDPRFSQLIKRVGIP